MLSSADAISMIRPKVRSDAPAVMDGLTIGVLSSMLIADVDNMVLLEHPLLQTTNF